MKKKVNERITPGIKVKEKMRVKGVGRKKMKGVFN